MLNQTVIVGRIVRDLEVHETENGLKVAQLTLAVPRSFKNMDGEYETDYIPCTLWQYVAENTAEYCKKGDVIGIKEVLVSCDKDNIASASVIKNCGGDLIHEFYSDTFNEMLQMYVIKR